MEKGYLCEKRCPFFVPGYRYADKGEGGKNHEKRTLWENAAFIRGSVYAYDGVWKMCIRDSRGAGGIVQG